MVFGIGGKHNNGQNRRKPNTKKFKFTYEDISRETGLSVGTLRVMKTKGKFDPGNLRSLVNFINLHAGKR